MLKRMCTGVMGLVFVVALSLSVCAQQEEELDVWFSTGSVQSVSQTSLTVVDSEFEEPEVLTFKVTEETELENISAIGEVKIGDEVYVDYVIMGEENIALNIYKIGMEDENSYMDSGDEFNADISALNFLQEKETLKN